MKLDYNKPKARTQDVVIQAVDQETLIYDQKNHQAHCLNSLSSLIWRNCDGGKTWQDLATLANQKLGVPNDMQVIELVLDELAHANLLETSVLATPEQKQYTRREVARRLGVGAAAALILSPLITSVGTATAASIASAKTSTTVPAATTTPEPS